MIFRNRQVIYKVILKVCSDITLHCCSSEPKYKFILIWKFYNFHKISPSGRKRTRLHRRMHASGHLVVRDVQLGYQWVSAEQKSATCHGPLGYLGNS